MGKIHKKGHVCLWVILDLKYPLNELSKLIIEEKHFFEGGTWKRGEERMEPKSMTL